MLCVTHLPQVAAFADAHFRVTKHGDDEAVRADVEALAGAARIEELARMLGRQRDHREDARAREGAPRAAPPRGAVRKLRSERAAHHAGMNFSATPLLQ